MVFESLVVDLINKYLGDYIAKLDKSQLKLGILGGNASIENLDIKENALDKFELPVRVVQGHIGKLTLKIPWKHLYSEPVIVELDGLYVLIVPNVGLKYDSEKEKLYKNEAKQKEILRIEESKAQNNEKKKESDNKDSFGEKLAAQIVKNLQIKICNIHIRYEDTVTSPLNPFSLGITLSSLSFQTCDSKGERIVLKDDATREFFKSVKMDSLALYWNSGAKTFSTMNRGLLKNAMKNTISSSDNKVADNSYFIQPISCSAMMHIHMRPEETNFSVPQLSVNLSLDQIAIGFNRNQYCDITNFLDSIDRLWTQNRFRKYRPSYALAITDQNNQQQIREGLKRRDVIVSWWKFPYTVILEEQIRRRRTMWSWEFIKRHRDRCRKYTELWGLKLMDKKLSANDLKMIDKYEEDLDLLNIILCRNQAEMKARKMKKRENQEKSNTGGWFSGWFGRAESSSASSSSEITVIKDKMINEFTQEEKTKLYMAIGYSENVKDPDMPKEYVSIKFDVVLHKLNLVLSDTSLKEKKLMKLSINSLSAKIKQRQASNSLQLILAMNSLEMTGSVHEDDVTPVIVSTQRQSQTENLLNVFFELNPLESAADQRIEIKAEPLEIVYDAQTINCLAKFFTPPEELRLYELSSQVLASLEEVKEMTATGLRHLAEHRNYTDIKVNIKPSYFILPEDGYFRKDCTMILVDFGSVSVQSQRTNMISAESDLVTNAGKLDYNVIKETAYDKFQINLSAFQMLLIHSGDDWRKLRNQENSKNHIFRPFGFNFNVKKCVISNDVNLPKLIVEGCLPKLAISISDKAITSILQLVLNVPLPQTEPTKELPQKTELLKDEDLENAPLLSNLMGGSESIPTSRLIRLTDRQLSMSSLASTTNNSTSTSGVVNDSDNDEFFDAEDSLKRPAAPVRSKSTSGKKKSERKRNINIIDLEAVFVLNTLEIKIFEGEPIISGHHSTIPNVCREILFLEIYEVGMSIMLRRFDLILNSFVGSLTLAVPEFKVKPNESVEYIGGQGSVCLIKTKKIKYANKKLQLDTKDKANVDNIGNFLRHLTKRPGNSSADQNYLLSLELTVAQKTAPDFATAYKNTRHNLNCSFKSVDICFHQDALLLIVNFGQNIVQQLNEMTKNLEGNDDKITWSQKVGDSQMIGIEEMKRDQFRSDLLASQSKSTNVATGVRDKMESTRMKRDMRMTVSREAVQSGKYLSIPENRMIQWAVSVEMEKMHMYLASKNMGYLMDISLHGMRANVSINYHVSEISVTMDDMRIQDPTSDILYRKLIWIDPGDSIFSLQVAIFNEINKDHDYHTNLDKVDMSLSLSVGKVKVVFMYLFIAKLMHFLDSFQSALDKIKEQTKEYQDAAYQQLTAAIEETQQQRIAIQINVEAPVIYLPESSSSLNTLMLDLGSLTFCNKFEFLSHNDGSDSFKRPSSYSTDVSTNKNIIIENSDISLKNVKLARATLVETTVENEKGILEPINISLAILRNLNYSSYKNAPMMDVKGYMASIKFAVNNHDCKILSNMLQNTFAEGIEYEEKVKEEQNQMKSGVTKIADSSKLDAGTKINQTHSHSEGTTESTNSHTAVSPYEPIDVRIDCKLEGIQINLYKADEDTKNPTKSSKLEKVLTKMTFGTLLAQGNIYENTAMSFSVKLTDISLKDMQLPPVDSINELIRINKDEEDFIFVKIMKDQNENTRVTVNVAGIYICMHMEFLIQLTDFFLSTQPDPMPVPKKTMVSVKGHEENPRKYRKAPAKPIVEPRVGNFEVELNMKKPEIIFVDEINNPNTNAILIQFEAKMKCGIMVECDIINANIDQFFAVFCPFRKAIRSKYSMDIISPTNIALYCKRPLTDGMQGSLIIDRLILNITPAVIQNVSQIVNKMKLNDSVPEDVQNPNTTGNNNVRAIPDDAFWEQHGFDDSDFPFISKGIMERINAEDAQTMNQEVEAGFDVAQMLLDVEQRRADQICVRLPDIRVVLESEVAKKCVPILILECSVEGDIKNPLTEISFGCTVSVSMSYFNDHINFWEPLIETYPDENNRQYCFEIEYVTCDDTALFAEEDHEDLACIEPSKVSIHLLSRDSLELTFSRSALDVLIKLRKSFEQAFSLNLEEHKSVSGAPYVFKNLSGLDVKLYIPNVVEFISDFTESFDNSSGSNEPDSQSGVKPKNSKNKNLFVLKNSMEVQFACQSYSMSKKKNTVSSNQRHLILEEQSAGAICVQLEPTVKKVSNNIHLQCRDLLVQKSESRALKLGFQRGSQIQHQTVSNTVAIDAAHHTGVSDAELFTIVADIDAYLGMKSVTLRSILKISNNTFDTLAFYVQKRFPAGNNSKVLLHKLQPSQVYNVPIPALYESTGELFLQLPDMNSNVSEKGIWWKVPRGKDSTSNSQIINVNCESKPTKPEVVLYFSANLSVHEIPSDFSIFNNGSIIQDSPDGNIESRKGNNLIMPSPMQVLVNSQPEVRSYFLEIQTPTIIHNQLPFQLVCHTVTQTKRIDPGKHEFFRSFCRNEGNSTLKIVFMYQQKEWFGNMELRPKMDELNVIVFKARNGFTELTLNIGLHCVTKKGTTELTIYSPYWMINKTGYTLTYKAGEDYIVEHPADNLNAVLFSFLSKSIFAKRKHEEKVLVEKVKAHLKIEDSNWSDKFSLDTVGNTGKINLKKKPRTYEVAVKISLSSSGLTRIVTFMPYYAIINQSDVTLYCNELAVNTNWIKIPPSKAVPFWPCSEVGKSMMMRVKVEDQTIIVSQPFPFYESGSFLLRLDEKYVGVFTEVQITEEANLITFQLYQDGMALVQIINHLGDDVNLCYKQYGTNTEYTLPPLHSVMYAWQDLRQKRELQWRIEGDKKIHSNSLTSDGIEDFYVNEMKAYWISFVCDMQRILLFTNDMYIAKNARLSSELETIDLEFVMSLQSLGLSLVDNVKREELSYISVTSSGVRWNQVRSKNRHKPLKFAQSEALEVAYEDYINKVRAGQIEIDSHIVRIDNLMEVDVSKKLMLKPEKCELTRSFEPGVFIQYRTSPNQLQCHLRIYRVQIDNQMRDCTYPVVFAPYPPLRSIAIDTGLKPLFEMSAVIGKTSNTGSLRFKYFRVLIQEMQLMLDQGFVNSLLDFLAATVPDYNESEMFKQDLKLIEEKLIETSTINSIIQGGKKCVFDNFHISPIKLHLTFSLAKLSNSGKTALHSEVLNLFLQSVGIALTDMQDVIFKLGYFEKQNSIMPMNQMVYTMMRHYMGQGLRQMYVLVLGLDVIGNPFGVIRGMAQGVEDLFYEPVRGAILGPEEFVEGVAFGVKSLFGHAVGGAAGAMSRIVGTMGKGIAALTLDADYQRKRREQFARKPENFGVGLAQGGKGLVTGIFSGVTGIITKPVEGARKDGVEGFFKGVGKGLVGVVTRPVSGVVDFASSSFEGIRRVAETTEEVIRIRPPRYIAEDGIIRSYGLHEAEGINIWKMVIQKNEPLKNEFYSLHIYCKSKKTVLMLTNFRVLLLERNEILASWLIQWQVDYEKLQCVPTLNEGKKTIVFTLKEKQRKLFAKDNVSKEIEAEIGPLKIIIMKMRTLMGNNKEQI